MFIDFCFNVFFESYFLLIYFCTCFNREKTIKTELGDLPLEIPRDRKSEFKPILVNDLGSLSEGLEEKIIALQNSKKKLASDLIMTDDNILKNLNKEELIGLFD